MTIPIPDFLLRRIVAFLTPGSYGRIEIDVVDGRVTSCRIMESIKVNGHGSADIVQLKG